ncbi:hypothetical protein [Metallibacterium sp.]|jgi:hypothetical protein|nr:hypothetical protein [Metallibacterium sp.]
MNIKYIRTLAVLASILMTVAMLAGVHAGFEGPQLTAPHALIR